MKKLVIIFLVVFLISFVSAGWFGDVFGKITGATVEGGNETEPEPEEVVCATDVKECWDGSFVSRNVDNNCEFDSCPPELECPSIIAWRVEDNKCVVDTGCDYNSSKYTYYGTEEKCLSQLKEEVEVEPVEPEPPEPEPEPRDAETCATKIKVTFDKEIYYIGDTAKIVIEILDSQGKPIPNYVFYNQLYDTRWHTAGSDKTDSAGYFRFQPIVEKEQSALGKIKFKVYTEGYFNCNSVEDIVEIEIREREKSRPVPCAMGSCIPIEEDKKEPKEISKDKVFYQCNGCELDEKCYPMGYRKEGHYCSDDGEFISQIDKQCDNNFECKSNVCISGECVGEGLMNKVIKWFKKMFGGDENEEEEWPGLEICSKLLLEKDIKDNEYIKSSYGGDEHSQVPVYSEEGKNIGTIKCCAADYSTGMVMVCPFDNEEEVRNSLIWVLGRGEVGSYSFGEYEGENVIDISDGEVLAWINKDYLIASGGKPESNNKFVGELTDAYLKRYSSDLDITEDDIPDVLNPKEPETWVTCNSAEDMLNEECHFTDDFESGLDKWTFSNGGSGYDGIGETLVEDGNTVLRLVGVERANVHQIWDNYLFKFRFKMIDGSVHVDSRRSEGYEDGARRYFVSMNNVGIPNLNKQMGNDWRKLEQIDVRFDDGWHTLEVRSYDNIINVYLDNKLIAKQKDTLNTLYSGWVRFEAHTGGVVGMVPELLIDDVEIRFITEDEIESV